MTAAILGHLPFLVAEDLQDRRRESGDFRVPPFIHTRRQCSMFPLSLPELETIEVLGMC